MKNIPWKTIIISAVITGLVGLVTWFITYRIQTGGMSLVYKVDNAIPFSGRDGVVGIYKIDIQNNGSKVVNEIDGKVSYLDLNGKIQQSKVYSEAPVVYQEENQGDFYKLHINNLNPGESLAVSLLVISSSTFSGYPNIAIRGEGVSGKELVQNKQDNFLGLNDKLFTPLLSTLGTAYAAVLAVTAAIYLSKRKNPIFGTSQREVFVYLTGVHGLLDEMQYYLNTNNSLSYWSESDHLTNLVLKSNDKEKMNKIKLLLKDLLIYADSMTTSSRGIVYYNIARISKVQGDKTEMNNNLEKAKKIIPKMVETRIKIDNLV